MIPEVSGARDVRNRVGRADRILESKRFVVPPENRFFMKL
jgi:hypothetical protein